MPALWRKIVSTLTTNRDEHDAHSVNFLEKFAYQHQGHLTNAARIGHGWLTEAADRAMSTLHGQNEAIGVLWIQAEAQLPCER